MSQGQNLASNRDGGEKKKKRKEQRTERAGEGRKGRRTYHGSGERLSSVPRPDAAEA